METNDTTIFLLTAWLVFVLNACAGSGAHWTYSGQEGPEHWGELDAKFTACSDGKNQSPVNLTNMFESTLPPIQISYKSGGHEILNNGHTIQINYTGGSTISLDGHAYELKQFHFHAPSENTIEGHSYAMEAHFVHTDKQGNLMVVAVMFEVGEYNAELEKAWSHMPEQAGEKHQIQSKVDANDLLPNDRDYYRYDGSLTTPPCSEGVIWVVMKQVENASKQQIEKFMHTMHYNNNRPIQPVNARVILK